MLNLIAEKASLMLHCFDDAGALHWSWCIPESSHSTNQWNFFWTLNVTFFGCFDPSHEFLLIIYISNFQGDLTDVSVSNAVLVPTNMNRCFMDPAVSSWTACFGEYLVSKRHQELFYGVIGIKWLNAVISSPSCYCSCPGSRIIAFGVCRNIG